MARQIQQSNYHHRYQQRRQNPQPSTATSADSAIRPSMRTCIATLFRTSCPTRNIHFHARLQPRFNRNMARTLHTTTVKPSAPGSRIYSIATVTTNSSSWTPPWSGPRRRETSGCSLCERNSKQQLLVAGDVRRNSGCKRPLQHPLGPADSWLA